MVGRILRRPTRSGPPGLCTLYNPLLMSVGRTFDYAGRVTPLIRLPSITDGEEIVTTMIILSGKEIGVRGFPAILEGSKYLCCELPVETM